MFIYLRRTLYSLLEIIFPPRDKEKTVQFLSDSDIADLPRSPHSLGDIHSLFSYKDTRVQALIWELKYHRNQKAIEIIAQILAESVIDELSDASLFENVSSATLVAVPITNKRLRERRFSQTDVLCREMKKYLPPEISYEPHALRKIKETKKQSWTKSRDERLKNLSGAFSADSNIVSGKNIILIDDVTTTGATIAECTRALKTASARSITAFTIAH